MDKEATKWALSQPSADPAERPEKKGATTDERFSFRWRDLPPLFICGTEKRPRREHHPGLVPRLPPCPRLLSVVDDNPAGVALVAGEGRARLMFGGSTFG